MIRNIGCYYFPGFYESVFNSADDFFDDELEIKDELGMDNIEVEYEYDDFNKYKLDVSMKFMEVYIDTIVEELPEAITEDEDFKFEMIDDSVWVSSPRYYNYETDRCYCEIKTNIETLEMIKEYTLKLRGVKRYILDNFTSYDGFVSFISNDYDYWKRLPIIDYEDNMLISLLDMMLKLSDDDLIEDIIFTVWECICKYEYVTCYVKYGGKEYTLNEFKKMLERG